MCGIAGFYQTKLKLSDIKNRNFLNNKLTKMRDSLRHRGPDEDGIFLNGFVGFAHTRLSIRDIESGHQPMTCHYRNRQATIVFNGEIYNTDELRQRLLPYEIYLQTTGDTEIILYSYLVFGTKIFKDLNGIFSFAIYEGNTLFLVRDHLGVKPLFYYLNDNEIVFASEPKGIFAYGIKPSINRDSWCEIIGLGPAHTLGNGVFEEINEVLPGHYLTVMADSSKKLIVKENCYWKLVIKEHREDYPSTICHCNYLIKDSVKRQMVSDIPICTFLSGGLDSSLVSAIVAKELGEHPLNTYSFDFVDNDKNFKASAFQSSRDRPFVDIMVRHIGSNHKYLECNNADQIVCLFKAVIARDMPCMADVESSMLYFCNLVSRECSVTLTGECADEIFGGYPWFHRQDLLELNTFPWSHDMNARTLLFKDEFIEDLRLDEYVTNVYKNSLREMNESIADNYILTTKFSDKCNAENFELTACKKHEYFTRPYDTSIKEYSNYDFYKICWLNVRWFMMTLLNRMDRCSMFSGLEARVPFADYRILEYVFNIPWKYKCYEGQTKSLLVECGKEYLPPEILYRKKSPYPKTYDPTYEELLGKMVLEEVGCNSALSNIIDVDKLRNFIDSPKDYGKPWYGQLMAGPQMLAYVLQIGYWLREYKL